MENFLIIPGIQYLQATLVIQYVLPHPKFKSPKKIFEHSMLLNFWHWDAYFRPSWRDGKTLGLRSTG
jgi:hypothetical protein